MKKLGHLVLATTLALGVFGLGSNTAYAAPFENAVVNIDGLSSNQTRAITANGQGSISVVNTGKVGIGYVLKKDGVNIGPVIGLAAGASTNYQVPMTKNAKYTLELTCFSGTSCSGMGVISNY
ncbi:MULTISPECIES: hypothetical protein [unclassified Lysinibacillus]|uniref:hypothetical protein n=1 Tax=unclassified Lysinibacillus TaxID=2636778 RepID=UPI00381351A3